MFTDDPAQKIIDGLKRRTPEEAVATLIHTHEGNEAIGRKLWGDPRLGWLQNLKDDAGNWVTKPTGERILIGTNYGITPAALAAHRGIAPWSLTFEDMKALTLAEAAEIGVEGYYREPGWGRVTFSPEVETLMDFGFGAGKFLAVQKMQSLVGVAVDGKIGPVTEKAFYEFVNDNGHEKALETICEMRLAHYHWCVERRPSNARFLDQWKRRARFYLTGNASWWGLWQE